MSAAPNNLLFDETDNENLVLEISKKNAFLRKLKPEEKARKKKSLSFRVLDNADGLIRALQVFKDLNISVLGIESKFSRDFRSGFMVKVEVECKEEQIVQVFENLEKAYH